MNRIEADQALGSMFLPGTILWRDEGIIAVEKCLTERGTYKLSVLLNGKNMWEPGILAISGTKSKAAGGILCFVECRTGKLPENWTHVVVTGSTLYQRGKGCLFGVFGRPFSFEDYIDFRNHLAAVYRHDLSHDERFRLARSIPAPEYRVGRRRLVCSPLGNAAFGFDFVQVTNCA